MPTNNFATLNSIYTDYAGRADASVYSEGNLSFTCTSTSFCVAYSTFLIPSSGKWYLEAYLDNGSLCGVGIVTASGVESVTSGWGMGAVTTAKGFGTQANYVNNSSANNFALGTGTPSNGDIYQLAIDADNNKVWIGLNNSWNDASGGTTGNPSSGTNHTIALTFGSGAQIGFQRTNSSPNTGMVGNFGQDSSFAGNKTAQGNQDGNNKGDFYYTPPTGFLALCTDNLPAPAIALPGDHFNTKLWPGTGNASSGAQNITGVNFQPDMLWVKARTLAYQHTLRDSIRGSTKSIEPNRTNAETTQSDSVTSFNSDGWSLGADSSSMVNYDTTTYVGWAWKAGGTAVSNTDGTITSSVSANPTAGFSIISYTGDDTQNSTIGHGLSRAPDLAIFKARGSSSNEWTVWMGGVTGTYNQYLYLNTNAAIASSAYYFGTSGPMATASTLKLGESGRVNNSAAPGMICYAFHSVEGYSKVGTYKGNNLADGSFIYTGFQPAWVMVKSYSTGSTHYDWPIYDSARSTYNAVGNVLEANEPQAEITGTGRGLPIDLLSNGFKHRSSYAENNSISSYVYLAFAETPFSTSNAR